jgi:hypothetical protein
MVLMVMRIKPKPGKLCARKDIAYVLKLKFGRKMSSCCNCRVINNAEKFLETLSGERAGLERFRENWLKCDIIPLG